jgi:predicted nucleic acid-binding protein
MSGNDPFFDTSVLLYLLSEDAAKADRAESLIAAGGVISVQVLNEFAAVALRKHALSHGEIREVLDPIRRICRLVPLMQETHDLGLRLAERYGFSLYDSVIVAAALLAGCVTLYTEDLQHGQRIEERLLVCDPFRGMGEVPA